MKIELTLTTREAAKSWRFHITLNIHCFYVTLFIFNQFSISILCGVMFIIIVFDTQILVSWLHVDVHIGKISNSTLLCQYLSLSHTHTHTHTHILQIKSYPNLFFFKIETKIYYNTYIKIYTQRNSEFNNYKQYKFLNITKKI